MLGIIRLGKGFAYTTCSPKDTCRFIMERRTGWLLPPGGILMKVLTRGLPLLVLGSLALASPIAAQEDIGTGSFKWYFGAFGGVTIFETTAQTDKASPMVGAEFFVTARRTALRLAVEETFSNDNVAVYSDASATGGVQQLIFNNIRKYSLSLMAVPLLGAVQPYIGVGVGWQHAVKVYPVGNPADPEAALEEGKKRGSYGFGSGIAGVQARMGKLTIFGTYQITTSPSSDKYFTGPTHAFSGGLRFSLGPAREGF